MFPKRKILGAIIGILLFAATVVSFTYAYYSWRSSNTNITFNINDTYFYCETDIDSSVSSSLAPVTDYKNGQLHKFKVNNVANRDTTFSLSMNIISISDVLKSTDFKYKLMVDKTNGSNNCQAGASGCVEVSSGNFSQVHIGNNTIVPSITLPNNSRYEYYFFMYIDGSVQNSTEIQNARMVSSLGVCDIYATFDVSEGDSSVTPLYKKVIEGEAYGDLPTPTRNDAVVTYNYNDATGGNGTASDTVSFTFSGWKSSVDNLIKTASSNVNTSENHTLTAQWTKSKTVTLPTPTKTGYTFDGWYSDSGFSSKIGNAGASYNPSRSINLYAKWIANTVTITLKTNNNVWSDSAVKVDLYQNNSSVMSITVSSGSDAIFNAVANGTYDVYAGKNSGEKTTLIDSGLDITVSNNSQTGTLNYYGLTLKKGTGISQTNNSGLTTSAERYYLYKNSGTQQDIAIDATVSTGYTWSTWTKTSGTTLSSITLGTKSQNIRMGAGKAVYTANATANSYTVAYNLNNGTNPNAKPTSGTYDTDVIIGKTTQTTKTLTFKGNANSASGSNATSGNVTIGSNTTKAQTFAGWTATGLNTSTAKHGTAANPSTAWNGTTKVKSTYFRNLTDGTGTVTLTANWTAVKGTLPTVTRAGYTCGWNLSNNSTTITYASGGEFPTSAISQDMATTVNLYAVCKANTATITIKNDGNNYSSSGMNVALYQDGASVYAYSTATASGATVTFSGVVAGTYRIYAGKHDGAKTTLIDTGLDVTVTQGTTSAGTGTQTVNYYTITRSQGTGTTLETRWDSASGSTFTNNPIVLGNNKVTIYGKATLNTGYSGTVTLKHGTTSMTASGSTFTVSAKETIASAGATVNTYTITLNNQNATAAGTTTIYETYGSKFSLTSGGTATTTITKPEKTGYTFSGYYSVASGGTQYIDADGNITAANTVVTDDATWYAHWSIINPEVPTITPASTTKIYGKSNTTLTCATTSTYASDTSLYYEFGWSSSKTGTITWLGSPSTTATKSISSTNHAGDRYFHCRVYASDGTVTSSTVASATANAALLRHNNATVTFDATTGGTIDGTSPLYTRKNATSFYTGIRNSTAATIPGATKDGYTFAGWYDGNTKVINADKSIVASVSGWTDANKKFLITENKTLTANWTGNTYTVTFYYYNGSAVTSTTATCTVSSGSSCNANIPTAVSGSTGKYGSAYGGLSSSTGNMTVAVGSSTTTVSLSANATYYAIYSSPVTIYYPTSTSASSSYSYFRNEYLSSTSAISSVIGTSATATSNFTFSSSVSGYSLCGFNAAVNNKTCTYTTVSNLASSNLTTAYTVLKKSVTPTFYYYNTSTDAQASTTGTSALQFIVCTSSTAAKIINSNFSVPTAIQTSPSKNGTNYSYRGVSKSTPGNATNATPNTSATKWYANYSATITITFNANLSGASPSSIDRSGTVYLSSAGEIVSVSITSPSVTEFTKAGKHVTMFGTDYEPNTERSFDRSQSFNSTWDDNIVTIYYNADGGTLVIGPDNDPLTLSDDGIILYNGSPRVQTVNYGSTITNLLDPDYYNFVNLQRSGYTIMADQEWDTIQGDTVGTIFSDATSATYNASDFCDATYNSCDVILYVNWVSNSVNPAITSSISRKSDIPKCLSDGHNYTYDYVYSFNIQFPSGTPITAGNIRDGQICMTGSGNDSYFGNSTYCKNYGDPNGSWNGYVCFESASLWRMNRSNYCTGAQVTASNGNSASKHQCP